MPLPFKTPPPRHRRTHPPAPAPLPAPPVAHVTHVERMSQDVVRFTFDTAVDEDLASCGDLQVAGDGPSTATRVDPFNVDATYAHIPQPATWHTDSTNNEPSFAGGATLATASGPVPPWV